MRTGSSYSPTGSPTRWSLEEIRELTRSAAGRDGDESVANAFDAVERIKRIVEGLRAYSTPLRAELADVDLHEVVRSALRLAQPQLRALPVVVPVLRPVPPVRGDAGKLVQAVMNAIVNAAHVLKAHPPATPATITVSTRGLPTGDAEIEVRDNGPGFPAELLPTLGQPFVTTRATDGGSGLGIFVIRGIVDAHGGTVDLANAEAGGAVLRIRLPRRQANTPQGTTAVASTSTTAPGSISDETSTAVMAG
jgi:signal transduction histidine kinase